MLLTILVIILVIALLTGGFGFRSYGYTALSPLAIVLIVILLLWATGNLR